MADSNEIERQAPNPHVAVQDEDRLAQFGYEQELKRDWVYENQALLNHVYIKNSILTSKPGSSA